MVIRKRSVRPGELPSMPRAGSNKSTNGSPTRRLQIRMIVVAAMVTVGAVGGILITHITASASHAEQSSNAAFASALKSSTATTQPTPTVTPTTATPTTATPTEPVAPQAVMAAPQVLTIGDSIMKGFGLPTSQAWPALIAAQNGWELTTLACNGAGFLTIGSTQDCGNNFPGVVIAAAALHPDIIIISGSSNDFGENNTALLDSTITAVTRLRAEFPNARIIGLSTVWGDTAPPAQLAQIDAQVTQAVEQVGGTYLDIGQPLSGHPEWMQADDVHPTADGQLVLDAAIQGAFATAQQTALQAAQQATVVSALAAAHGHL